MTLNNTARARAGSHRARVSTSRRSLSVAKEKEKDSLSRTAATSKLRRMLVSVGLMGYMTAE